MQQNLVLLAFDRDPSSGFEASLNVMLMPGSPPRLSLDGWRSYLERERGLAQQHGVVMTIVDASIATLGGVPVGRAIVDTRWGRTHSVSSCTRYPASAARLT